jgi:hypothetical protein
MKRSTRFLAVAAAAAIGMVAASGRAEEGVGAKEGKPSNKDLYLAQPESPGAVRPTVKFWAETGNKVGGRKDIVTASGEKMAFRSGDSVDFKIGANVDAYFYLVNKGSTGKIAMLYPGEAGRENKINARQVTSIDKFKMDDNPGEEQLCLVVSPTRIPALENAAESNRKGAEKSFDDLLNDANVPWVGKTKDLTLEQDRVPESSANYVTDHGSQGFSRPFAVRLTLQHKH